MLADRDEGVVGSTGSNRKNQASVEHGYEEAEEIEKRYLQKNGMQSVKEREYERGHEITVELLKMSRVLINLARFP